MDYAAIVFRTLFFYGLIIIIFRVMGKREIGELSILDLVVFIMIGEMAVVAIEKHDSPLLHTMVPMIVLMALQIILAIISLKSKIAPCFMVSAAVAAVARSFSDGSPTAP